MSADAQARVYDVLGPRAVRRRPVPRLLGRWSAFDFKHEEISRVSVVQPLATELACADGSVDRDARDDMLLPMTAIAVMLSVAAGSTFDPNEFMQAGNGESPRPPRDSRARLPHPPR